MLGKQTGLRLPLEVLSDAGPVAKAFFKQFLGVPQLPQPWHESSVRVKS